MKRATIGWFYRATGCPCMVAAFLLAELPASKVSAAEPALQSLADLSL
jgi:hypothetical protein